MGACMSSSDAVSAEQAQQNREVEKQLKEVRTRRLPSKDGWG
jgi:hypothetical protein